MNSNRIPRYVFLLLTLGLGVAVVMLSMFYAQYRWLADEITTASEERHAAFIRESFSRRAEAEMHALADHIALTIDPSQPASVMNYLSRIMREHDSLTGLRFTDFDGNTQQAGSIPGEIPDTATAWLERNFIMQYPVSREGESIGTLIGSFQLAEVRQESIQFAQELLNKEQESRAFSIALIGGGTLAILLLCGVIAWLIVRGQSLRIRELKTQAEKLRDADYGEPLPEYRGDELGELAAVFNDMRDKLRSTTITRDYLDSLLSGMNEAIIVTSKDGTIDRINKATTMLLGYDEQELIGVPIDFVVDTNKTATLMDDCFSDVPKRLSSKVNSENRFRSRSRVPWSATTAARTRTVSMRHKTSPKGVAPNSAFVISLVLMH